MTSIEFQEKLSDLRLQSFLAGMAAESGNNSANFDDRAELLEIELIAEFDRLSNEATK